MSDSFIIHSVIPAEPGWKFVVLSAKAPSKLEHVPVIAWAVVWPSESDGYDVVPLSAMGAMVEAYILQRPDRSYDRHREGDVKDLERLEELTGSKLIEWDTVI